VWCVVIGLSDELITCWQESHRVCVCVVRARARECACVCCVCVRTHARGCRACVCLVRACFVRVCVVRVRARVCGACVLCFVCVYFVRVCVVCVCARVSARLIVSDPEILTMRRPRPELRSFPAKISPLPRNERKDQLQSLLNMEILWGCKILKATVEISVYQVLYTKYYSVLRIYKKNS
jgi:hypothetical protein